jgi:3-dehydroquinate dehydratase/shikimate dehydrogenase
VAELRAERLLLRHWRDEDLEPFAELNADPETMRYFPAPPSRAESDALAEQACRQIEAEGWGLWAVEVAGGSSFIGFVGLARRSFEEHFTPAVEVGWRLARQHWGRGHATEAGRAAVAFGFEELGLDEIVSFTSRLNEPSWRVMERLGMSREPGRRLRASARSRRQSAAAARVLPAVADELPFLEPPVQAQWGGSGRRSGS